MKNVRVDNCKDIIETIMAAEKISMTDISDRTGVSYDTIRKVLKYDKGISAKTMRRLIKRTGYELLVDGQPFDLLGFNEYMKRYATSIGKTRILVTIDMGFSENCFYGINHPLCRIQYVLDNLDKTVILKAIYE